ncbi:3428_t:CDS:2 [Funneliformis mosseae]|uniref:3428_t:CDS:1 n=1 Tax=Funneliformis mosseae TaxID=27381 RepID=A0A9N8VFL5_FUNMO|nr:3428_t:CDS:2 [Funneliformis mosseae]
MLVQLLKNVSLSEIFCEKNYTRNWYISSGINDSVIMFISDRYDFAIDLESILKKNEYKRRLIKSPSEYCSV